MAGRKISSATLTTPAASDMLPLARVSDTTPRYTTIQKIAERATGWVNVKDYGAAGDGSQDDTTYIENAINSGAEHIYFPETNSFYKVTRAISVPSNVSLHGSGAKSYIKHTGEGTTPPAGWGGGSWAWKYLFFVGNYSGEADAETYQSIFHSKTWYGIAAASAGDLSVTLDTAANDSNFSVDDIVFIQSGDVFSFQVGGENVPKYSQVNKVRSISSGVLTLYYPLNHSFDGSSSIATDAQVVTGWDGETSYVAENVTVENLKLEVANTTGGYPIYASCFNCSFRNLDLISAYSSGIGANPIAYTTIENVNFVKTAVAGTWGLEIAYFSNNVLVTNYRSNHGRINIGEGGSFITLDNCYFANGGVTIQRKHDVTVSNCHLVKYESTGSAMVSCGVDIENAVIHNNVLRGIGASTYGIIIGATTKYIRVTNNNIIASATTGYQAINISSSSDDYVITGNVLGINGSRTLQDVVLDQGAGQNGRIENNITYLTRPNVRQELAGAAYSTAAETVQKTYTIPAGSLRRYNSFRIRAWGTVAGTNNTKTIRIRFGGISGNPVIVSVGYTAGQTGAWLIDMVVYCNSYSNIIAWYYPQYEAGALDNLTVSANTGADLTANFDITLTFEVANASDSITLYGWVVEQIQDQWIAA